MICVPSIINLVFSVTLYDEAIHVLGTAGHNLIKPTETDATKDFQPLFCPKCFRNLTAVVNERH